MKKRSLYQLVATGPMRFLEGRHTMHSRRVYTTIAEAHSHEGEFVADCTTERGKNDLYVLDRVDNVSVVELELQEED